MKVYNFMLETLMSKTRQVLTQTNEPGHEKTRFFLLRKKKTQIAVQLLICTCFRYIENTVILLLKIQKFIDFCDCTVQFVSHLVRNTEELFS